MCQQQKNNTINTNLDKTCAEYGMDLLNLPNLLYKKANAIIKNSSNDPKIFETEIINSLALN